MSWEAEIEMADIVREIEKAEKTISENLFKDAYNLADKTGKSISQFREQVDDKRQLAEEAFYESAPIKSLFDGDTSLAAPKHCDTLIFDAIKALQRNDKADAIHQLKRELEFCKTVPKMTGNPHEKTGKAGLDAIEKQKPPIEVIQVMGEAWNKAWVENPAPFYKTK